jgi:2-(1,2-epoxy-1,2-dihydrophenyl)acetyl-CoA isomerase
LVKAYRAIEIPIVVAAQGGVAGAGLMYPLGADFVIGDDTTFLVFAHQRVGLTPDGGTSYLLPRVVGERMARELVLGASRVDASHALALGILSSVVPAEKLQEQARARAGQCARAPSEVTSAAKRLINCSLENDLDSQLQAERDGIVASVGRPAFHEGVMAFVEKRPAVFWRDASAPDGVGD